MQIDSCPVCESNDIFNIIDIPEMPVYCNRLWDTREQALKAERGDIHLVFCRNCGHIYNKAFNPDLMQYSQEYENSLHYSPRFQSYAQSLAEELVKKYNLYDRDIIEIGCGKGDFLQMLCMLGGNRGTGFDPSFEDDRMINGGRIPFRVIRDYYSEKYGDLKAQLLVCRHVLEHIESPGAFLKSIRRAVDHEANTVLFFEVPNIMYTLKDNGIWDLIYEHCGYFTTKSLISVFQNAGFHPTSVKSVFGGQYITIEANSKKNKDVQATQATLRFDDLAQIAAYVESFAEQYREKVAMWRHNLHKIKEDGRHVVVWGAGSKGVTFVNILGLDGNIEYLVDINPHKQGKHIPGSGQKVISPADLLKIQSPVVLVMNPLYQSEIEQMLVKNGISAQVRLV